MRTYLSFAVVAVLGLTIQLLPRDSHASFIGHTLQIEWHFDDLGEIIATENNVVGAGIEFTERFGGPNIDVGSTTIDFFGADASSFAGGNFNGFVFTDTAATIAAIVGVTISSQTGYTGFTLADISFTADQIVVNFQSVGSVAQPNNQVQLTVQFAVPEPATLVLLGLGLLGIGSAAARRKRPI